MKVAAMVLGIIGGVWGIICGWGLILSTVLIDAIFSVDISCLVNIGVAAIFLSICGIVGGGMVRWKPKVGGICMLIGSIGMIVPMAWAEGGDWRIIIFVIPMLLLIAGGVLALMVSRSKAII